MDIVKKKLDALLINKSSGPDGLSARVLKEMSDVTAMPVYILFKNSLQTGTIPKIWKTANITAIYNKLTCRPKKRSADKFDSSDQSYCQFLIKL